MTKTNQVGAPSTPSSAASASPAIPFYPCPVRLSQLEDAVSGNLRSPAELAPLKPSPHVMKAALRADSQGEALASLDSSNNILKKKSLMTFRLPDEEPDLGRSGQGISSEVKPRPIMPYPKIPKLHIFLRQLAQYAMQSLVPPCSPLLSAVWPPSHRRRRDERWVAQQLQLSGERYRWGARHPYSQIGEAPVSDASDAADACLGRHLNRAALERKGRAR